MDKSPWGLVWRERGKVHLVCPSEASRNEMLLEEIGPNAGKKYMVPLSTSTNSLCVVERKMYGVRSSSEESHWPPVPVGGRGGGRGDRL